jgi:CubicO group peptidase (beta-lactamase class C family)
MVMNKIVNHAFFIAIGCMMLLTCENLSDPSPNYTYSIPRSAQHEFFISSLEEEGMDENLIVRVTDLIMREKYPRMDGLLILRNNKLIYENYFHGHSSDILHNMFSAGKSITAILVGIAIDKGFINSTDIPIVPLLPEYQSFENPDPRKDDITIEHLLNMSAGLDCDDWYQHTEARMQQSNDWVKFTLDLPIVSDPGSRGSYCTGCAVTLGRIIENQSGLSLEEFANQYLFEPLNITRYQWHIMPDGRPSGGGLIFLRPRDMAKIGLLMLNNGVHNGKQIVPGEWVQQCSQNKVKLPGPFDGYGNLWWKQAFRNDTEAYFASGNGGQDLFVIPSEELVIVFTSGNENTSIGLQNFEIVNDYVLSAIK